MEIPTRIFDENKKFFKNLHGNSLESSIGIFNANMEI